MKKIISMLLCLVLAAFTLVGCGKDRIGDELDDSMKGYVKENLTLNFYIVGDPDNDNATVNARISNYTVKNFNANLNIVYVNENEYQATVIQALDAAKLAIETSATDENSLNAIKNKPDFFLINSLEMMTELYEAGHLADITEFFKPELYEQRVELHPEQKNKFHADLIKKCEGLKNQIAESLMEASIILEEVYNETTRVNETLEKYYCVPNNRVVGSYTYLLIHRDTAEQIGYVGSSSQLAALNTWEATAELRAAIEEAIADGRLDPNSSVEDYVKIVDGKYEDKAMYENGTYHDDDKKYACNILAYPEVAGFYDTVSADETNVENVFDSVFAVNKYADTDRVMEIIYALNTDNILHNYLQYGVQDTNYRVNENGLVDYSEINTDENGYFMNPLYTGDMFKIIPNDAWTEADKTNGKLQNDQSRLYK